MFITGNLVDIKNKTFYPAQIEINDGKIQTITKWEKPLPNFILPGFVDAHVHIESSMLVPSEFARIAVVHGTVATVSDPHEIANVNGLEGVEFMIENGNKVPFKFNFGAPSCVPATSFETAGAVVEAKDIETLMARPEVKYLAEMMNYPGVLFNDPIVMDKIAISKKYGKPIDGHAPGLMGDDAIKYIHAGISTDHECYSYEEALHKLKNGMKVIIREGSAAKNFDALIDLLPEYYEQMMFCSDDKHPDNLLEGHINQLAARAVAKGIDVYKVLQACCINPVEHYKLDVGQLKEGDFADFIVVDNLIDFPVLETWIDGKCVAKNGESFIETVPFNLLNNFNTSKKSIAEFKIKAGSGRVAVIEALDGELITNRIEANLPIKDGFLESDTEQDILKMALVNRYKEADTAHAFIKNFGLKSGAIASCVGHDSHNIVVLGVDDESICKAVNLIIENKGGISAVDGDREAVLPLPVAGIMSDKDAHTVAEGYSKLDKMAKEMGSTLNAPYMTLSFMALLVIPSLKLSDLGLFDGSKFEFTPLQLD